MEQHELEPGWQHGHVTCAASWGSRFRVMLCCHQLKILHNFEQGVLHFLFVLDPVADLEMQQLSDE